MKKLTAVAATVLASAAGNALAENQLEHCNETLGTLAVIEDHNASWYYHMQQYRATSTVPLLRMLVQQSRCFVVVERGQAMNWVKQERNLYSWAATAIGSNVLSS